MKHKRKILVVGTVFYLSMLFLSVSAKRIHTAKLPKVTVTNLETKNFGECANVAIPKEVYDSYPVYIIEKEILNGEERSFAKEVTDLVIGQSDDLNYEVIQGLTWMDQVIVNNQNQLKDGCEVYVENKE